MWPVARDRLVTALRAGGVEPDRAEDAVAEAFTRALARRLVVRDVDEFCRWAFVVARNNLVDAGRRNQRVVLLDVMPEAVDPYDLADHVVNRQRLIDAGAVIARMSDAERSVLLDAVNGMESAGTRKEAVGLAVRRHRARARLRQALGAPAAWLGVRKTRWISRLAALPADSWPAVAAIPMLAFSSGLLGSPAGASEAAPASVRPPAAATATVSGPAVAAAPMRSTSASRNASASAAAFAPARSAPSAAPQTIVPLKPGQAHTAFTFEAPTGDHAGVTLRVTVTGNDAQKVVIDARDGRLPKS
jgi:CheY-like chemotaxis protein